MDLSTLIDLIMAANYLDIRGLLDVTCSSVADMIKRNSPEGIKKQFITSLMKRGSRFLLVIN